MLIWVELWVQQSKLRDAVPPACPGCSPWWGVTGNKRRPGGLLTRYLSHLIWLLSMWRILLWSPGWPSFSPYPSFSTESMCAVLRWQISMRFLLWKWLEVFTLLPCLTAATRRFCHTHPDVNQTNDWNGHKCGAHGPGGNRGSGRVQPPCRGNLFLLLEDHLINVYHNRLGLSRHKNFKLSTDKYLN